MTVADVKRILQLSDPIDTAFDLRLPVVGGPKRTVIGCHNLMWLDDYVNKVYFYKGRLRARSEVEVPAGLVRGTSPHYVAAGTPALPRPNPGETPGAWPLIGAGESL